MLCYRIVSPRWADTALSGEGARLYGGRWNSPGKRCVYAAGSRSLAALEMLVHLTGTARGLEWSLLTFEIPDKNIVAGSPTLPIGWDAMPPGEASQSIGDTWLEKGASVAMRIPSVVIPEETNVLINPLASNFESIKFVERRTFQLDLRLANQS